MSEVKCEDCRNYVNEWCEEINDCPYPDMPRNCEYFSKKEKKMNEELKRERFDYGQRVYDKMTDFCGRVTGYVHYYDKRPAQYLVESVDTTGRPIEEWVDENRLEKGAPM